MPNGRSGGFRIKSGELDGLLSQVDGTARVARARKGMVTASELRRALQGRSREIIIEEQDGEWYIARLDEWVVVDKHSPLFDGFRHHHAEWRGRSVAEHPPGKHWWQFWK